MVKKVNNSNIFHTILGSNLERNNPKQTFLTSKQNPICHVNIILSYYIKTFNIIQHNSISQKQANFQSNIDAVMY